MSNKGTESASDTAQKEHPFPLRQQGIDQGSDWIGVESEGQSTLPVEETTREGVQKNLTAGQPPRDTDSMKMPSRRELEEIPDLRVYGEEK